MSELGVLLWLLCADVLVLGGQWILFASSWQLLNWDGDWLGLGEKEGGQLGRGGGLVI